MLSPQERSLLVEAMRPPAGQPLDWALLTTYSLDLTALLTIPLGFVGFERATADEITDPLVLLAAIRRNAGKVVVFCQAGQMTVPQRRPRLLHELESTVVECVAHDRLAAFHPKVGLLRFEGEGTTYRLLCASRNLTHDRCWDTLLTLDGDLLRDSDPDPQNDPLVSFFESVSGMAVRGVPDGVREQLRVARRELPHVRFTPPPGFRAARFWPLGIGRENPWPFPARATRVCVVSPFLSARSLDRIAVGTAPATLISRVEALDTLGIDALRRFADVRVFAEVPEADPLMAAEQAGGLHESSDDLHAKLYIIETGDTARIFTGSANATDAAYSRNVEMLVELEGSRGRCGIDAFLSAAKGATSLSDFLVPYKRSDDHKPDDTLQVLEERLHATRVGLATAGLRCVVRPGEATDAYVMSLDGPEEGLDTPSSVKLRAWPLTLPQTTAARDVLERRGEVARWHPVSLTALTPFIAFEARTREGTREQACRFVLNVPLVGAPETRLDQLLKELISSRSEFLRLLRLLVAEDVGEECDITTGLTPVGPEGFGESPRTSETEAPVLESLLRALDRDPRRLDQVATIVDRLRASEGGAAILPPGFTEAWDAIFTVRAELKS